MYKQHSVISIIILCVIPEFHLIPILPATQLSELRNSTLLEKYQIVSSNESLSEDSWDAQKACANLGTNLTTLSVDEANLLSPEIFEVLTNFSTTFLQEDEETALTIWIFIELPHTLTITQRIKNISEGSKAFGPFSYNYESTLTLLMKAKHCICFLESENPNNHWCQGLNCTYTNVALCDRPTALSYSDATTDDDIEYENHQTFLKIFWISVTAAISLLVVGLLAIWRIEKACHNSSSRLYFNNESTLPNS